MCRARLAEMVAGAVFVLGLLASCSSPVNLAPKSTPRPSPTATALPTTIGLNSPILGGSWEAFDNLFGERNWSGADGGWIYRGQFGNTLTQVDTVGYNPLNPNLGPNNPNVRITDISIEGSTLQIWNLSQARVMVDQFLPPDAKLQTTKTFYDPTGVPFGIEETYTSALLARTLPKADFTDASGYQDQPGVFYAYLDYGNGPNVGISALATEGTYILDLTHYT
ncbi:MAG: hypothetical protein ACLQUY_23865 [Ktedonobacterales bacterium]